MKVRIAGLAVQILIWLILFYLYFDNKNILEFPNYLVFAVLLIALFIYFTELLFKSMAYVVLDVKPKIVRDKMDIIKYLTNARLYLEIHSKAFHYRGNEEVDSYNKKFYYEFEDVKDHSSVKTMPLYFDETCSPDQLVVVDVCLSTRFSDYSCQEELDACVTKLKNDVSFKDKYFETKTTYILKGVKKHLNVFSCQNKQSFFVNKTLFIISYLLLVGEFYKLILDSYIVRFVVEVEKQINRTHANKRLGKIVELSKNVESMDESAFLLDQDNLEANPVRKSSNEEYFYRDKDVPKLENFDNVFVENSMTPLIRLETKLLEGHTNSNTYINFRDEVEGVSEEDFLKKDELPVKRDSNSNLSFGRKSPQNAQIEKSGSTDKPYFETVKQTSISNSTPISSSVPKIDAKSLQNLKESQVFSLRSKNNSDSGKKEEASPRFSMNPNEESTKEKLDREVIEVKQVETLNSSKYSNQQIQGPRIITKETFTSINSANPHANTNPNSSGNNLNLNSKISGSNELDDLDDEEGDDEDYSNFFDQSVGNIFETEPNKKRKSKKPSKIVKEQPSNKIYDSFKKVTSSNTKK